MVSSGRSSLRKEGGADNLVELFADARFVEQRRKAILSPYRANSAFEIESFDELVEVLTAFMLNRSCAKFRLYIGEPLPDLLASERLQEALLAFTMRKGVSADFIVDDRAYRLWGTSNTELASARMLQLLDPNRKFWEPRREGYAAGPGDRFFISDARDVWWDTLKGSRPPEGSEYRHLLDYDAAESFQRRFEKYIRAYGF